jgi:uncharacterized membrane protein
MRSRRLQGLALAGIATALYALHVENTLANPPPDYEPLCSTSWGSCATVFTSEYSRILSHWQIVERHSYFDISLPVAGILNYTVYMLYPYVEKKLPNREAALFLLSCASVGFSCYLLYILKYVLQDFCIVCTTFHVINFSTFFFVALPEFVDWLRR